MPPALPVGWTMPFGKGFTMLHPAQGVRPPSVVVTMSVVCVKPRVPRPALLIPAYWCGAQKSPYPPRTTVLAFGDQAKPTRGATFVLFGSLWCVGYPSTPAYMSPPLRFAPGTWNG